MPIRAERGYLIPAIGEQYERCANRLRHSILAWHPDVDVTVVTTDMLPHGDQGGQANDWQMFEISPYRQTIKLEADMWCASEIDHWWTMFEHRDVVISQGCRDLYDRPGSSRHYRRILMTMICQMCTMPLLIGDRAMRHWSFSNGCVGSSSTGKSSVVY